MASLESTKDTKSTFKNKFVRFFRDNFEIQTSNKAKGIGIGIFAATLLWVILSGNTFISQEFAGKWFLFAFVLICPFILGLTAAYTIVITNDLLNKIWHFVFLFLLPFITITMTECLNNIFIYNMTYLGFLGNYIVVIIAYFIVFALSGSLKLSYLIITPILYGFSVAHSYIMDFRGTPFIPMDFLSVTTAVGVANTYNFAPNYKIITATLIFIFIIIIGIKTKTPKYNTLTKVISRTFAATFSSVLLILFFFTGIFADMGIRPDFWNQTRGYRNYGFVFSFFSNTKYLYMSAPNEYNPENLNDYVNHVVEENKDKPDPSENLSDKPNIICIMNESLADLGVLGDLETNKEYMPFLKGLTENTVKGNLYVPVIGAGTSNTEFEFLTGHTTAFLPSGSNAYMLYIKNHIASLVSTMEAQHYSSYALHPYYAAGWKRTEVYNNLGFNKFTSLENIIDISIMNDFQSNGNNPNYLQQLVDQHYPGKNMLVRQYISDSYNYKLLIEDYENRDKTKPYFAFNVTMQNHGGYTTSCANFAEEIYATNVEGNYIKANKYLSLVKYSDDAFKELIDYFSNVNEPTVICMFGDHQPSVEPEFIAEVMGIENLSNLTPQQEQSRYCTPFYIWANYDIKEENIEKLSVNYLSSLVLKTAGIELTGYNKYLLELSKTLPVIDNAGYIDNDGNYYKWSDSSPYTDILDEYEKIQYNNIFDREHVNLDIFYIEGYTPPKTEISSEDGDR